MLQNRGDFVQSKLLHYLRYIVRSVPIASPFPLKSWLFRSGEKFLYRYWNSSSKFGGTEVGERCNGNALVRLNRNCPLGTKGSIIELPKDEGIYKSVIALGYWEIAESKFLALELDKSSLVYRERTALIDIGANTGLVTLQVRNLSKAPFSMVCFEPLIRHIEALEYNLRDFADTLEIRPCALTEINGKATVFSDLSNYGNTTLISSVVTNKKEESAILTASSRETFEDLARRFDYLAIKSDTQGLDPIIFAEIPDYVWPKIVCAIIEVWALPIVLPELAERVVDLIEMGHKMSWESSLRSDLSRKEVLEFWLSGTGHHKNLYVARK